MNTDLPQEQVAETIDAVLRGQPTEATLLAAPEGWLLRVRCTKSSQGQRPDGLREDAPADPGFSFAVAEGMLELRPTDLDDARREAVHRILWMAGTDDWNEYSHLSQYESADLPPSETLALLFSSTAKATAIVASLRRALGR